MKEASFLHDRGTGHVGGMETKLGHALLKSASGLTLLF